MKRPYALLVLLFILQVLPLNCLAENCSRLISLAPSITETLYAVGLGAQIQGVSTYCKYPPEAINKVKIGGYLDPNYEVILGLKPTLVIHLKEQRQIADRLKLLGIKTLEMDHSNIRGILQSVLTAGQSCAVEKNAKNLYDSLNSGLTSILGNLKDKEKKRVLIAVGRTDVNSLQGIYAAGNDGFLGELLSLAGGINVNQSSTINFPAVSSESLFVTNPQVIIEIIALPELASADKDGNNKVIQSWERFGKVEAVKNHKIFILNKDYMTIPGPRFILALEDIEKTLCQTC